MDLRFRPIEFKSSLSDVDCTNRCHCGCDVSQFYAFVSFLWLTTFFKSLQTRKCKIFVKRTKVLLLCLKNVVAINLRTSDEGHSSSLLWNRTRIWVKFANATLECWWRCGHSSSKDLSWRRRGKEQQKNDRWVICRWNGPLPLCKSETWHFSSEIIKVIFFRRLYIET